jgi:hypothetical protein
MTGLTAEVLIAPGDREVLVGAGVGVGCDGRAQTLAVPALVARTRVVHTALHVLGVVHHAVARGKQL